MSKRVINDLKKEIANRERELQALVDAVNLIASASSGAGRKVKVSASTFGSLLGEAAKPGRKSSKKAAKKGTGRRGRPPGSKNKKSAKKPGPKPKAVKSAAPAKAKRGPGRPPKAVPAKRVSKAPKPRRAKVKSASGKSSGGPVIITSGEGNS